MITSIKEVDEKPPDKKSETVKTNKFKVIKAELVCSSRRIKRFILRDKISEKQ